MSSAETAEPIKMQFGRQTRVGPRNHVFDGGCTLASTAGMSPLPGDPIWHVSSRSGEASRELLYSVYLAIAIE